MLIRKFFLENPDNPEENPVNPTLGSRLRIGTWIIIALAAFVTLHSLFIKRSISFAAPTLEILVGVLFTAVHVLYLYLIFHILIISYPPDRQYKQRFLYPFLLLVAAILSFSSVYLLYSPIDFRISNIAEIISCFFYLLFYLCWGMRDYFEANAPENVENRGDKIIWLIIDMLCCIVLAIAITEKIGNINSAPSLKISILDKEFLIILCLFMYALIKTYQYFQKESRYKVVYLPYLLNNSIAPVPTTLSVSAPMANPSVLDFGCGNGLRLAELLDWMGLKSRSCKITGYEKNITWRSEFLDKWPRAQFICSKTELKPENYDVLIFSHVLYDHKNMLEIEEILNKCKGNAIIVIRGASPASFFTGASYHNSLRLILPSTSHLWYSRRVPYLMSRASIRRLSINRNIEEADARIGQKYELDLRGIEYASKLLTYLYPGSSEMIYRDYLSDLKRYGGITQLSNEDLVYLFVKSI